MVRTLRHAASWAPLLGGATVGFLAAWVLARGWDYYRLPVPERPLDPRHADLRPSGRWGLTFGMAGTAVMLLNLTYLARKRLAAASWLGSLRSWMRFHVLTGLTGPALVVLHTAFAPSSTLGLLAVAAMGVVVATGLAGRYLYARVPRSVKGRELELVEVERRLAGYRDRLEAYGVGAILLPYDPVLRGPEEGGWLGTLELLLLGDREGRRLFRGLRREVLSHQELRPLGREILPLAGKFYRERQWLLRYRELRGLMGSWRFLHRWLAVVLFVVVAFHVLLAVRFGDLWILRER